MIQEGNVIEKLYLWSHYPGQSSVKMLGIKCWRSTLQTGEQSIGSRAGAEDDTLKGDIVAEGDGRRVAERERVERSGPLASLIQVSRCIVRSGLFTACLLFIQL